MKETKALIQRVRALEAGYQQIELGIDEALSQMKTGQVLLARPRSMRTGDRWAWDPYMREVWHPVHLSKRLITVEQPTSRRFSPGDTIDLIGPVGQPYRLRQMLHNVLLLAYDTPPIALMVLIPYLLGKNISVTLVLLGTATDYPTGHLPPEIEIIRGENPADPLDWPDQVTTIGWADRVFAVVPPGDELTVFAQLWTLFNGKRADVGTGYLFGVFQSLLPCGVGACDACMVRTRDGLKLACMDGPAMDLSQLILPL